MSHNPKKVRFREAALFVSKSKIKVFFEQKSPKEAFGLKKKFQEAHCYEKEYSRASFWFLFSGFSLGLSDSKTIRHAEVRRKNYFLKIIFFGTRSGISRKWKLKATIFLNQTQDTYIIKKTLDFSALSLYVSISYLPIRSQDLIYLVLWCSTR